MLDKLAGPFKAGESMWRQ